ncbi:unnamed protein product [Anisakis simplex]|uniref:Uncharacterized protein n=1 Tax=Anisakis simplex TaxID=6269 RepID=A0A3P6TAN6_ANISI|nr:unnamed protein product [Anisakis simplex]VDK80419.1 unnamed protein product [Anisakis simplex]
MGKDESFFNGRPVPRERRISVICRDLPHAFAEAQERAAKLAAAFPSSAKQSEQ